MAETIADRAEEGIGPGRLVLVVGPSGAGKDTLIGLAREACRERPELVFPRRTVTRAASAHERNEFMSEPAFDRAQADGAFALWWQAHGLKYGLRAAIDADIRAGRVVVVNVSRMIVAEARKRYANVCVVMVTAPPNVLAERLATRGRASDGKLADRLNRAVGGSEVIADVEIVNVGPPAARAREFLTAIAAA
jgi:ribose 1,5-bisphosphokinase